MARAYRLVRDHVDDVVELVKLVFTRRRTELDGAPASLLAEQDIALAALGERIEARLQASLADGFELPLDRLRTAFQLTSTEQRCLEILVALAVSGEARELADAAQGTSSVDVLDELVYSHASVRDRFASELAPRGRLLGYSLAEYIGATPSQSRFTQPLRITDRVVDLVYGSGDRVAADVGVRLVDPAPNDLLIDSAHVEVARRALRRHVETGSGPVLVLRGATGSGRRSLVAQIARELGARLLVVELDHISRDRAASIMRAIQREAILERAIVVLVGNSDPTSDDDRTNYVAAAFADYPGPVALVLPRGAGTVPFVTRGVTAIDLELPSEAERIVLWSRHLDGELATSAALRYRLTGGQIESALRAARDRGDAIDLHAIHRGVRTVLDGGLSVLGVRLEWKQRWDDLVLPDDSREELTELVDRVLYRRRVIDEWGFGDRVAKGLGVAALFYGPPGTGKTMAAGLVAKRLELDLYQIDVSRLVSKYIGETEKNLAKVFEAAEAGHAVLLFDEADSLFAKRTEVKSSVDRYANLEVNYLLQRMESFDGITILTTNFESSLDEAFRRRLAYRIRFPVPEVDERSRLWQSVIPTVALGTDVDFELLAERFEMTGGYIKNAALRAAFIAASEHEQICMRHLMRAASSEYASLGKVMTQGRTHGL